MLRFALKDVIGNNHGKILWRWEGGVGVEVGGRGNQEKNKQNSYNERKALSGIDIKTVSHAKEG